MKKYVLLVAACFCMLSITLLSFKAQEPQKVIDQYWVLKPGRSISTTPSDYQLGGSPCTGSAEFCGFHAPENGSTDEPVISGDTETDLENLEADPETPSNESGKISYEN
ncbi:hypothetical protein [Niabella ginsengisoli]|uniref:Secreted protein n=1 Tax=Niabella ginsengisoli TaxID=522298 RepID=A0ABS9SMC7_9BACT|nr:hypothetical protein [Niabella ginsengisoli]MCH5599508.1 hypothetical protein [Niabella ginsengisoli]